MHLQEEELKFYVLGCMSGSQGLLISTISSHIAECDLCADKLPTRNCQSVIHLSFS